MSGTDDSVAKRRPSREPTEDAGVLAVIVGSAPYGHLEAAEAVRHLGGREVMGFDSAIGLFHGEGVRALVRGQRADAGATSLEDPLRELAAAGVRLIAERVSLAERRLSVERLIDGVEVADSLDPHIASADVALVF